jgi:hypothetical protein
VPRVTYNGQEAVTPSADTVGSSQITDGGVATADLAAQAVTLAKISRTGGSSGQVLTHQGPSADPAWSTPSASGAPTVTTATTTDETETTCGSVSPSSGTHAVRALVAASSGSVRIAWELVACVTVSSGAATLGYVAEATCTQDPAPYSVALDTSGGAVRVRVTGAASTTIAWAVSLYVSGA